MDPVSTTAAAVGASAALGHVLGSKELMIKVLGPTAEYFGEEMKLWAEKRHRNLNGVFRHAVKKLGNRIDEPGAVSPRVLKGVLEAGAFCDDELSAEYFGGVLASSKSGVPRDDRGVVINSLLSRMSIYQIRAHFVIYSILKKIFEGESLNVANAIELNKLEIATSFVGFCVSMGFEEDEFDKIVVIIQHVMFGLAKERLIEVFQYGYGDDIKEQFPSLDIDWLLRQNLIEDSKEVIVIRPSTLGFELYLWAHGLGDSSVNTFLSTEIEFVSEEEILMPGEVITATGGWNEFK